MSKILTLEELWDSTPPPGEIFDPRNLSGLPEAARRYLEHAIAPGTLPANAVRLKMHGHIKLNRWFPFIAEQVIVWGLGMVWRASTRVFGFPIKGFDRFIDGSGEMRWKLFGIFAVMKASGPDISRSAAGRLVAESVWLPSALCREDVTWETVDSSSAHARLQIAGRDVEVEITADEKGGLTAVKLKRWGNPDGGRFQEYDFGGYTEAEKTFSGYTIPAQLRVGWHFGSDRFEPEGEFFRCMIDYAEFK